MQKDEVSKTDVDMTSYRRILTNTQIQFKISMRQTYQNVFAPQRRLGDFILLCGH